MGVTGTGQLDIWLESSMLVRLCPVRHDMCTAIVADYIMISKMSQCRSSIDNVNRRAIDMLQFDFHNLLCYKPCVLSSALCQDP